MEDRHQDIKFLYEFQIKTVMEATNSLSKGMTFYLAIMAALVGYFLTQETSQQFKTYSIFIGLLVSIFGLLAGGSIAWGIHKGMKAIERTLKFNNPILYEEIEMNKFIKRGQRTILMVVICSIAVVFTFSISLILINR